MDVFAQGGHWPVEEQVVNTQDTILVGYRDDDEFLAVALEHGYAEQLGTGLRAVLNSYATLGRRSSQVTLATLGVAVVLAFFSPSWIVWTGVMIVMLAVFGRHHPRTFDEDEPLDRTRLMLAVAAVIMFAICFTPVPLKLIER